jgi:hypothetical protein
VFPVRRLICALLAVWLLGLLLPLAAHAHSRGVTAEPIPAPLERVASLRAAAPTAPPIALPLALAAGVLLAVAAYHPRRALALSLAALLVVFTAEAAVHSVHHLGDHAGAACAVAATACQLAAVVDHVSPAVQAPPPASVAVTAGHEAPPPAPRHGPDPARAPPAPIA